MKCFSESTVWVSEWVCLSLRIFLAKEIYSSIQWSWKLILFPLRKYSMRAPWLWNYKFIVVTCFYLRKLDFTNIFVTVSIFHYFLQVGKVLRIQKAPRNGSPRYVSETKDGHSSLTLDECRLWKETEDLVSAPTREIAEQLYVQHVITPLLGPGHVDAGVCCHSIICFVRVCHTLPCPLSMRLLVVKALKLGFWLNFFFGNFYFIALELQFLIFFLSIGTFS